MDTTTRQPSRELSARIWNAFPVTEPRFAKLLGLYLERSFISGVQPKVLARLFDKSALATDDYIVKTWGDEYPNLAENEFFCLSAARRAGLPVPAFHLSDDRLQQYPDTKCAAAVFPGHFRKQAVLPGA